MDDTTKTVEAATKTTQDTVKEVSQFTTYLQNHIPDLISFGIKVVFALVFFFIGRIVIRWILTNNSLTNATAKDERRLDLKVDISYDADLKKAKAMIMDVLNDDPAVLREDEIVVFVDELGESSVVLGARAWTKSADFWQAKWRILENIKEKMDENQIEIPYRQLTVHMNKNA